MKNLNRFYWSKFTGSSSSVFWCHVSLDWIVANTGEQSTRDDLRHRTILPSWPLNVNLTTSSSVADIHLLIYSYASESVSMAYKWTTSIRYQGAGNFNNNEWGQWRKMNPAALHWPESITPLLFLLPSNHDDLFNDQVCQGWTELTTDQFSENGDRINILIDLKTKTFHYTDSNYSIINWYVDPNSEQRNVSWTCIIFYEWNAD